jgi:hypothetical protein
MVYKSQGIEVSDRVLEEGVEALKGKRFAYETPGPSLARAATSGLGRCFRHPGPFLAHPFVHPPAAFAPA